MLTFIGDMLLGWGVEDETLSGLTRMFSAYTDISDLGIFLAAILGLFGIAIEGLCYFGIYRLMAERAPKYAHRYRAGIFGYMNFWTMRLPCAGVRGRISDEARSHRGAGVEIQFLECKVTKDSLEIKVEL